MLPPPIAITTSISLFLILLRVLYTSTYVGLEGILSIHVSEQFSLNNSIQCNNDNLFAFDELVNNTTFLPFSSFKLVL